MPLSFRAVNDLAISHCTGGRKIGIHVLRSDILPAGTPKRRLIECNLDNRLFLARQIPTRSKRQGLGSSRGQSARRGAKGLFKQIERDWYRYRGQIGRDRGAKVKMCTPVHGLYVCSIAKEPESACTGVHICTVAPQSRPIWLLYQSRPISILQLK